MQVSYPTKDTDTATICFDSYPKNPSWISNPNLAKKEKYKNRTDNGEATQQSTIEIPIKPQNS